MDQTNISKVVALFNGKYKILIITELLEKGVLRFSEIKRLIPDASPKMLSQQLKELEKDKLVIRKAYPVVPPKVEYYLSELGNSVKPLFEQIDGWGHAYDSAIFNKTDRVTGNNYSKMRR